jgi:hypothetical protein
MQGLDQLYGHTGRRGEWAALVREITPDFVDPATGGPRPGHEEEWSLVAGYRVHQAREARQWAEAERLQRGLVDWTRGRAAPALAAAPDALAAAQRHATRSLAVSPHDLGQIRREQGRPDCVAAYEEATSLFQRIGDRPAEAAVAFNLGTACKDIPSLRDLAQA